MPITSGEAWADLALREIPEIAQERQVAWADLLHQCRDATGSSPNAKWKKAAGEIIARIGAEDFSAAMIRWFPLTANARNTPLAPTPEWLSHQAYAELQRQAAELACGMNGNRSFHDHIRLFVMAARASG